MVRLDRGSIDTNKWDACISRSNLWRNPLYGHSWYLDETADSSWHGLVWGDYDYVAPVCSNRKLIFEQVYRPSITQQLGIYGYQPPALDQATALRQYLEQYRRCVYTMPSSVGIDSSGSLHRSNFLLALDANRSAMDHISSKSQRQHVKQALSQVEVRVCEDVEAHVGFVQAALLDKYQMSNLESSIFKQLGHYLLSSQQGYIIQALDSDGTVLSSSLIATVDGYATLLLGGTSPAGRPSYARSLLIYETIRRSIATGLTHLDFEGSDIPGVAQFFSSFGAVDYSYQQISHDRMPWPIRLVRPI